MYPRLLAYIICMLTIRGQKANILGTSIKVFYPCGPSDVCLCNRDGLIDCSNTNMELKTVCEYIGNIAEHVNLTVLDMGNNSLGAVNQKDLKGCEKLEELDLSANEIETVEDDTFSVMLRLVSLNLQRNNLSSLYNSKMRNFRFPKSVKILKLNGNANVPTAQNSCYPMLDNLDQLETLTMDGVPNSIMPANYRNLIKLETVILSGTVGHCTIPIVKNETFENLPSVKVLNLNTCNIREVWVGGFKPLRDLEVLDLSENMLLGFRTLRNISYSLQFTNIQKLNYSKVHKTFGLATHITLRDICFLRNTSLTEIDISRNRIQHMDRNSPMLVPDTLKIIHVDDNIFTFGLYILQLGCISNVEEVYGSYQGVFHDPSVFVNEPQSNDIRQNIPDTDNDCPYMELDYLRNVSAVNKDCIFFEPGELEIDDLTYPKFINLKNITIAQSNIAYNFYFNTTIMPNNIEYIDLSRNTFNELMSFTGPTNKLTYLDMSQCDITNIHKNFFDTMKKTLTTLQLQQNNLGNFLSNNNQASYIFNNFSELRILNLSTNTISSLPRAVFSGDNSLQILDLSFNKIEHFSIDVDTLQNLLHLNLRNNFIHSLPVALLHRLHENSERLNKSYMVDLRNNTININCNNKAFLQWVVNYSSNMVGFQTYTFVDMEGNSISTQDFIATVLKLDQACASYTVIITLCSVGLSVYLAVLIGGVLYKHRWNIRYILRNAKIGHFRYSNHLSNLEAIRYQYDVFISYANENVDFVLDKLMPDLENKGLQLCLHDKNFLPGNNIADNILDAITNSRWTVVLLSKDFVKSKWCLYEFNMARMESIYTRENCDCLIVVILEEVASNSMSDEMLHWIGLNTYLQYTEDECAQQIFWDNLEAALM